MKRIDLVIITVFSAVMFIACEKEETKNLKGTNVGIEKNLSKKHNSSSVLKNNFYVVGSENNPYNELGYDHNQILDFMRSTFSPTMSNSDLYQSTVSYAENTLGYDDLESNLNETNVDSMIINYNSSN